MCQAAMMLPVLSWFAAFLCHLAPCWEQSCPEVGEKGTDFPRPQKKGTTFEGLKKQQGAVNLNFALGHQKRLGGPGWERSSKPSYCLLKLHVHFQSFHNTTTFFRLLAHFSKHVLNFNYFLYLIFCPDKLRGKQGATVWVDGGGRTNPPKYQICHKLFFY